MTASVRTALRTALTGAMKERDRAAVAVYRSVLGALDNAEAVPAGEEHRAGALEESAAGAGAADVPRRELTEQELVDVVAGEALERRRAAAQLDAASPERAERLRREAALLEGLAGAAARVDSGDGDQDRR